MITIIWIWKLNNFVLPFLYLICNRITIHFSWLWKVCKTKKAIHYLALLVFPVLGIRTVPYYRLHSIPIHILSKICIPIQIMETIEPDLNRSEIQKMYFTTAESTKMAASVVSFKTETWFSPCEHCKRHQILHLPLIQAPNEIIRLSFNLIKTLFAL